MQKEPKYIAYRIDLKRFKEFYSMSEAVEFFGNAKSYISEKSSGYNGHHIIGNKINERWLIFSGELKNSYVQKVLNDQRSEYVPFPNRIRRLQQT